MRLIDKDKINLLNIARETIYGLLKDVDYEPFDDSKVLQSHCGIFVTLYKNERMRGCIGKFNANYEIYKVVSDVAREAFEDNRFAPIELDEMDDINIEISVITPFKKIVEVNDIEIGKHGIYMLKSGKSGTYLPNVAVDNEWTLMELLGHCAQDKMGLGWNDWDGADIFVYEAETFNEKQFKKEEL